VEGRGSAGARCRTRGSGTGGDPEPWMSPRLAEGTPSGARCQPRTLGLPPEGPARRGARQLPSAAECCCVRTPATSRTTQRSGRRKLRRWRGHERRHEYPTRAHPAPHTRRGRGPSRRRRRAGVPVRPVPRRYDDVRGEQRPIYAHARDKGRTRPQRPQIRGTSPRARGQCRGAADSPAGHARRTGREVTSAVLTWTLRTMFRREAISTPVGASGGAEATRAPPPRPPLDLGSPR